jgi:hypothetical protein
MLCGSFVKTDVSEESSASIIILCLQSVCRLLVTANVPSSQIIVTLMMETLVSYEMSVLTKGTWHSFPENGIFFSHRHENLKSYVPLTGRAL